MGNINHLENEKITKLLIRFSLPAIIGMVVNASYNIVDRIFVGRGVGSLAISGIAVTFPLVILFMAFGMLIGIGSTALVSIRLGQKKKDEAEKILGNAFTLTIIMSILMTAAGFIFMEPLLKALGASGQVLTYAKDYLTIILYGTLFSTIAFSLNNIIRGEGNPKMAMMTMVIGAIINTALNPIFIFYLHMGIKGSALATLIATAFSSTWVLAYLFSKRSLLRIKVENMKLDKKVVGGILAIGSSPFALQLATAVIQVIAIKSVQTYGGDIGIAALGIINAIFLLIFMPIFGINQGVQPIVGYNYGAKLYHRVRETLKISIMAASGICITGFIVIMFFSEQIMGLFAKNDPQLVHIGSHGMRIFLLMLPIVGFQVISASYFQAVGKPKKAILLTLSRQIILLIPLLLILPRFFHIDGVWMSVPIADFISSLLGAGLILNELRHLGKDAPGGVQPAFGFKAQHASYDK